MKKIFELAFDIVEFFVAFVCFVGIFIGILFLCLSFI